MFSLQKFVPAVIRTKYSRKLLLLLSIVILAIATIGTIAFVQTGDALQANTEGNLEQSTQLQANTLTEWIQRNENHVRTVSTTEELRSGDSTQIADRLQAEQGAMTDSTVALHYTDSEFEILESTADVAGENLQAEGIEWAEDDIIPADGQTTTVDPYTDPLLEGSMIAIVSSVPDTDRLLIAVIDLETQSESLISPSPVDGAFTHVVNSKGTVVLSHHTHDINQQNVGSEDNPGVDSMGVMRGLEGETGYVEMEMDHGLMTMGYAPVEGTDWVLMTHIPADEAFALQDQIGQLMLALLGVSLVGLGTVGVIVGRNTSRSLTRLTSKANELERGNLETELQSSRNDEIGQLYDAFANMRDSLKASFTETEAARDEAEQQRQQLETFAHQLEQEAGEVMAEAAEGDLTGRIDIEGNSKELEQVARDYNEMIADIEQTTAQLKRFAATVAERSEEVTASAEEVQNASESVSQSVQTISAQTTAQDEKLHTVSDNVGEVSTTTEEIATLSYQVSEIAEETAQAGEHGRNAAQQAINAMDDVDEQSEDTVAAITALEEEISQVEEIAGIIAEISKEMNMLALNANIEASRSITGEDAGFSAVAKEVKALSQDSKESAEEIADLTDAILMHTKQTVEEVQQTRDEITESQETVQKAADAHENIADYAERTSEGISEISAATEQQAAATQEIAAMVEEVAESSSEVATEVEEVAAATEEQTSSLTEVTENAKRLSNKATELQTELDRFETSSDINHTSSTPEIMTAEPSSRSKDDGKGVQSRDTQPSNDDLSFEFRE